MWARRSHLLTPLTDLVGECGHAKATKKAGTKKRKWHWEERHQQAFGAAKASVARETLLAYPNYGLPLDAHADSSMRQLGAAILQLGKPIALFSRKLTGAQCRRNIAELELLSIVECLKEL